MKLTDWSEIEKTLKRKHLLLGNGASIAIDSRLSYHSLYEQVCNTGKLKVSLLNMFDSFKTSNFEFIMRLLLEASQVNNALNIEEDKTKNYYYELREALISTVRDIHPQYADVEPFLIPIAKFLAKFRVVFSLNYDLVVYWAMLAGNNKLGALLAGDSKLECQWFKDCFVNGGFKKDFQYMYYSLPPAKGSTLVFYPHGNLFLATDIYGDELKLSRSKEDYLLEEVLSRWQEKDYLPLFVSEGITSEKYRAIARSDYLSTVYDSILRKFSGSLVIYGWSASDQDEHIFGAIDHKDINGIAISVHTKNPQWESHCEKIEDRLARTRHLKEIPTFFFDSTCKGCWIY